MFQLKIENVQYIIQRFALNYDKVYGKCLNCGKILDIVEFWGDFNDRGYYKCSCSICKVNFLLVVHYNKYKKDRKGGLK